MKNWKDTLTTIFGIIAAICGGLLTASQTGLVLPTWLISVCGALATISVAVIGWLSGKNPNLTKKTELQVEDLNNAK